MYKKVFVFYLFLISLFLPAVYSEEISIAACGDIMLGRYIGKDLARKGYHHPYEKTKDFFYSASISFGNLECPISDRGISSNKKYCFRANPKVIDGLVTAGFDILSLANNHILDYGRIALNDTVFLLNKNNILTVGAGKNLTTARKPAIIQIKTTNVAFLAYNCTFPENFYRGNSWPGTSPGNIDVIREDIKNIKKENTLVVVSFHWGEEYSHKPSKKQILLAHQTIDAGADLIIGHHPHVVQGLEFYKGKPIFYSLGNFIFDQAFGNTGKGFVVKCIFNENKTLSKIFCLPIIRTYDKYYPQFAAGKEREEMKYWFLEISKSLNQDTQLLALENLHFYLPPENFFHNTATGSKE